MDKYIVCRKCDDEIKDNGKGICYQCLEETKCESSMNHIRDCKNCQEDIIKNGEEL